MTTQTWPNLGWLRGKDIPLFYVPNTFTTTLPEISPAFSAQRKTKHEINILDFVEAFERCSCIG